MSFEPQLLINYDDLLKHKGHIEAAAQTIGNKELKKAYAALLRSFQLSVIHFQERAIYGDSFEGEIIDMRPEIRLVLIHPELTIHNKRVRDLLDQLEIEFKIAD